MHFVLSKFKVPFIGVGSISGHFGVSIFDSQIDEN